MEANPRLGSCNGKPCFKATSGRMISEKCGEEMSVGMTKFYRVACFEQIGGFVREVIWDAVDCHKSRQLGWIARSWDDTEIRLNTCGQWDRARRACSRAVQGTAMGNTTWVAIHFISLPRPCIDLPTRPMLLAAWRQSGAFPAHISLGRRNMAMRNFGVSCGTINDARLGLERQKPSRK